MFNLILLGVEMEDSQNRSNKADPVFGKTSEERTMYSLLHDFIKTTAIQHNHLREDMNTLRKETATSSAAINDAMTGLTVSMQTFVEKQTYNEERFNRVHGDIARVRKEIESVTTNIHEMDNRLRDTQNQVSASSGILDITKGKMTGSGAVYISILAVVVSTIVAVASWIIPS